MERESSISKKEKSRIHDHVVHHSVTDGPDRRTNLGWRDY